MAEDDATSTLNSGGRSGMLSNRTVYLLIDMLPLISLGEHNSFNEKWRA